MLDPLVDVFLSRDLDSAILDREVSSKLKCIKQSLFLSPRLNCRSRDYEFCFTKNVRDYFRHQLPDSKVRDKKMNREDLGPGPSARPWISFLQRQSKQKSFRIERGRGGKVTDDGAIIQSRTVNFAEKGVPNRFYEL